MKKVLKIFLAAALALSVYFSSSLTVSAAGTSAKACVVMEAGSGRILYSKNPDERLPEASTTKIMTALVVAENVDADTVVRVPEQAQGVEGSSVYLRAGEHLTVKELLYGLMLQSGNDCAVALALTVGGSIENFAAMMNEEAKAIGATGTHFTNPHGLTDEDHYTTAYDLYLIYNEAMKEPEFRKIVGTPSYYAEYVDQAGETVTQTWKMGNQFLTGDRETPEGVTVTGGKTGTTSAAGYCLIISSQADSGEEYISVVLKADSRPALYDNMTNLVNKIVN